MGPCFYVLCVVRFVYYGLCVVWCGVRSVLSVVCRAALCVAQAARPRTTSMRAGPEIPSWCGLGAGMTSAYVA